VIVTGIVAGSLLLGGLAEWLDSGFGVGRRFAGYTRNWDLLVLTCYVVGAVGVIWLGWYWRKLAGAITSIARLLKQDKQPRIKAGSNTAIRELSEAINERLDSYSSRSLELEKKMRDLQIQIQLSQAKKKY